MREDSKMNKLKFVQFWGMIGEKVEFGYIICIIVALIYGIFYIAIRT